MPKSIHLKQFLLFLLLSTTFTMTAQNNASAKKNYSLLWEISGNGLTKPSYLFGTMHLRDKRVFDFSDSVLIKFDACDAFASEIRMDSTMYEYWELAINGDTTNRIRNRLSKKGYSRMKEAFKKKGMNFDSLYSKNTALLQDWLDERPQEEEAEGSKKQFLDLYLTRLAYNQGKNLIGLENLNEYKDLNTAFFERFEDTSWVEKKATFADMITQFTYLETMIETYNSGDLDSLSNFINQDSIYNKSLYKTELLDNRNLRMTDKLSNMMRTQSVFCAVGAAHLPDSLGMIALLRKKGYTVRKVSAPFTGLASQYKEKIIDKNWYHVNDDFHNFEIDMPEQPYKVASKKLGKQYVYYDISNSSLTLVDAEYYPHMKGEKKSNNEKILNDLIKRWLSRQSYVDFSKEKVKIGDIDAFKFKATTLDKGLVIGWFTMANNLLYRVTILYDKNNKDDISKGERILKSFKINPLPLTDWQNFADPKGAFSVRFPTTPQFDQITNKITNAAQQEVNYYSNIFLSKDSKSGFVYLLRYSDLPNGSVILDDNTYMNNILGETTRKFKDLNAKIEMDSVSNHYGYQERNLKITADGFAIYMRFLLRGSRFYLLMGQPPLVKDKSFEKISTDWLNSFKLEPYAEPQMTTVKDSTLGISFDFPTTIEKYTFENTKSFYPFKNIKQYSATHNYSGITYFINCTSFSKYYSVPSSDSLWNYFFSENQYLKTDTTAKKAITVRKDTVFNGLKAKYVVTKNPKITTNISHELIFERNGKFYECGIYVPNEETDSLYIHSFFNSIKLTADNDISDLYSSKKELIINDLASDIDSISSAVKRVINEIDWNKSDIALLTTALFKNYKDDSLTYNSAHLILLEAVKSIKDSAVLSAIEKMIATSKDTILKEKFICALLDIDTLGSVDRFFEIAKQNVGYMSNLYCLSNFMADSLERGITLYDKMLTLFEKPFENERIGYITWLMASSDTLGLMKKTLNKYTPQYLEAAQRMFDENSIFKRDTVTTEEYDQFAAVSRYVKLCPYLEKTPEVNSFLNKVTRTQQNELLCDAIYSLVKSKQKISNDLWQRASKNKSNWYSLLSSLNSDTLLQVVPLQYYTQKDIAEGNIQYNYDDDDMGEPDEMGLLDIQKYKGQNIYIFKLVYKYNDEIENYIAIIAQPSDKSKVDFNPDLYRISEQLEDFKDYKTIVKQMLKEYENLKEKRK